MTDRTHALAQVMQLHAKYCDAILREDAQAFVNCFAENIEWRHPGVIMRGRSDVKAAIEKTFSQIKFLYIQFDTPILDIDELGGISARTHMNERCAWRNGHSEIVIGRYFERYAPVGTELCFGWRLWQGLYKGPPDMTGKFYDATDYGPPPGMPEPNDVPDAAILT